MFALRILAYLAVAGIGTSLIAYVVSRDRRYLRYGWRILQYGVIFALVLFALMALERLILVAPV